MLFQKRLVGLDLLKLLLFLVDFLKVYVFELFRHRLWETEELSKIFDVAGMRVFIAFNKESSQQKTDFMVIILRCFGRLRFVKLFLERL